MGLLLRGSPVSPKRNLYLYGMTTQELRMMMLDIDGILTHHHATPTDVLTAAQALATSAIGDLCNKTAATAPAASRVRRGFPASSAAPLHRAAASSAASVRRGLPASSASPFVRCQAIPSPKPPHTKKSPRWTPYPPRALFLFLMPSRAEI